MSNEPLTDLTRHGRWRDRGLLNREGSVAVELAFVVPIVAVIAAGIADFGALAMQGNALAGAARIGAEYARDSTTCQSGINTLVTPATISSACTTGIQNAMSSARSYGPAFSFPGFTLTCECDDTSVITCGNTLCTAAPAPKRMFITVRASQSFSPMISWPGIPTTLNGSTEIRIQ